MASTVIHCNKGKIDSFAYAVTLIKSGTKKKIDIGTLVANFDIYQSLNTMAMQMEMTIVDAADALASLGIQPADSIEIELFKDIDDDNKINSTFSILSLDSSKRIPNTKGRIYKATGLSPSALYNKKATVIKSYTESISDIVTDIAKKHLQIPEKRLINIEKTNGKREMICTGKSPYALIWRMIPMAVSAKNGASLYFFYETSKGFYFQSLKEIVTKAQANAWTYTLSIDINRTDSKQDFYKIIDFHHIKIGDQGGRMDSGIYENELMQFNVMSRTITSKKWNYKDSFKEVQNIGNNSIVDLKNNYKDWVTDDAVDTKGVRSFVLTRSDESAYGKQNFYEQNFNKSVAIAGLFNQIIFHYTLNGNPGMNVGDMIKATAPSLSGKTQQEYDKLLTGNFIIGNLRHSMIAGETYNTYVNVFSDGNASNYATAANT